MISGRGFAIENEFMLRDIVYALLDEMQMPRIVTGIFVRDGYYEYECSTSSGNMVFREFEITREKTIW